MRFLQSDGKCSSCPGNSGGDHTRVSPPAARRVPRRSTSEQPVAPGPRIHEMDRRCADTVSGITRRTSLSGPRNRHFYRRHGKPIDRSKRWPPRRPCGSSRKPPRRRGNGRDGLRASGIPPRSAGRSARRRQGFPAAAGFRSRGAGLRSPRSPRTYRCSRDRAGYTGRASRRRPPRETHRRRTHRLLAIVARFDATDQRSIRFALKAWMFANHFHDMHGAGSSHLRNLQPSRSSGQSNARESRRVRNPGAAFQVTPNTNLQIGGRIRIRALRRRTRSKDVD